MQSLADQMIEYCENKHPEDADNDLNLRNLTGVIYGGALFLYYHHNKDKNLIFKQ